MSTHAATHEHSGASPEKIPTLVFPDSSQVDRAIAARIAELIRAKAAKDQSCVLGLATGSTPIGVYEELVRLHNEEGLSFANVITFNLDEYFPIEPRSLQSYRRFMNEHLFDRIDIGKENIHIPDGTIPLTSVNEYCAEYERAIERAGGIDLQLLGIGRTGHVGFNEPGSARDSRTRLITLDRVTRLDAASDFFGEQHVPRRAITMGVGAILAAKCVVMLAFGEGKAPVVAKAIEGPITSSIAASFLQQHANATVYLDEGAAAEITRQKSPWLAGPVEWNKATIRKATIWLALHVKKPILKLTDEDYNEHGLQDLLAAHGSAYDINLDVFRWMTETITGWPGGKPESAKRPGDIDRPTDAIFPKRVLVFSPHPDDDVISMGGTLIRLVDQGHEVHVAYQTSGNIAVFDADAIRFADFAAEYNRLFQVAAGTGAAQSAKIERHIEEFLRNKKPGQVDSPEVQQIKGLIRRGEARAAGRDCGVPTDRLHFMDLPFYETGTVRKKPLGEEDIRLTVDLLEQIKPHQVYAAGDLSDPHGTHRVCLSAVFRAFDRLKDRAWAKQCEIRLYRGAWQEWEPDKIELAVPLSPSELGRKRSAVFKHQSQKDKAMFPGADEREFWQRAEERNHQTARVYDQLGLAEYEAIEGFVRWRPEWQ
ncbi:MAG: glucosamine-6-phosphate deaminase [Anaerolineae bacterium]|nr:glucosamine-6-phosphate deaminase [Phycisphaerae bacterium]